MQLLNLTGMAASVTLGMDVDGGQRVVAVVKGSYALPQNGQAPRLLDAQAPLVVADTFAGPPGASAATMESELCPVKPRCDVLLAGSAWAPGGALRRVVVGLQVGGMRKAIAVHGDRVWRAGAAGIGMSEARPFERMPISYDRAFGGVDARSADPKEHRTYLDNPVGRGWHHRLDSWLVDNAPVPNTEEPADPVRHPAGKYRPMAFGPVGRNVPARARFAGTYDARWQADVFPFLPADFDTRYYQAAPPDQQVDAPRGGERVLLVNLTPDGRREFALPSMAMPVSFVRRDGAREDVAAMMDTLVLEPDAGRFSMVWRASLRLRRDPFEIAQVIVGRMTRGRLRAMDQGKSFRPLGGRVAEGVG